LCMKWRMRCCTAVNALTTKQVRETEAEAVAFVVCESVGLQTGTASADYIQLWNGDAKLLAESLKVVQRTAAVILGAISPRTAEEAETAEQAQAAPVCSIQLPIADEAVSGVSF
jgi:DNA transposition AAA+ family ATPase